MSRAPSSTLPLRRSFIPLALTLTALVASGCRDIDGPAPRRVPSAALAAKSGIRDSLPFRVDERFRGAPGATPFVCAPGISIPSRLVAQGVIAPHMGRTTSVLVVNSCQVTDGTPVLGVTDSVVGATGDSLFGDWIITISNIQNGKAALGLEVLFLSGSGWFQNAIGSATGSGVIDLATGTGSYSASGTIGPRPEDPITGGPPLVRETISGNFDSACGLTAAGAAYCWGDNEYGQLGDGTTTNRSVPTLVAGAGAGGLTFTQISTASRHTCALTTSGVAYCWGENSYGELGTGDNTARTTPTAVSGGHVFTQIASGVLHACGVTASGAAYCWGYNSWGQLGDGTTTNRNIPVTVAGGLAIKVMSGGSWHTCALTTTGTAYCWGYNKEGQLGDSTVTARRSPTAVAGGHTFAQIDAGVDHTCALADQSMEAWCWGWNDHGQLGDGSTISRTTPTQVASAPAFAQIAAGVFHTCAVTTSSEAYCWGENLRGQLGDGGVTARSTPTLVSGGHEFARISTGYRLSCAVTTSGVAYCWGENGHGAVGVGSTEYYAHWTATQVSSNVVGGLRFARLSGGNDHTCGLTSTGLAYCWGENSFGALGDGTTIARHVPSMVAGGFLFKEISTGALHTCALQTDGQALCWGNNRVGQLGDGTITDHTEPAAVSGTLSFAKIATGSEHSCAIASGGAVYCWGNNDHGQLGDGSVVAHYAPTLLPGPYAFRGIAAGKSHTCALTLSGAAYCWGNWGVTETHTPELVPAAGAFVELEAGDRTTCGIMTANNVLCWGINANGQLADGTTSTVFTPTSGQNEDGALLGIPLGGLSVGGSHACFLAQPNSTAYCSGWNYYGQLGDNTTVERHLAVPVYGTFTFQSITAGGNHTCALSSGAAYCWGRNEQGQLGNDETSERHAPAWVTRLLFRTY